MTRPIKFRAWDKKHRKFVLPETDDYRADIAVAFSGNVLTKQDNGACGDPECCGDYEEYMAPSNQGNFTLMQFTGLLDRNGKEIWEGDYFKAEEPQFESHVGNFEVVFMKGCFWGVDKTPDESYVDGFKHGMNPLFIWGDRAKDIEVIGNIYENPELLTN